MQNDLKNHKREQIEEITRIVIGVIEDSSYKKIIKPKKSLLSNIFGFIQKNWLILIVTFALIGMAVKFISPLKKYQLTVAERQGLIRFGSSILTYAEKVNTVITEAKNDMNQMRFDVLGFPNPFIENLFERVTNDDASFAQYVHNPNLSNHIVMMNELALLLKNYGQALVDLANYDDPSALSSNIKDIVTDFNIVMNSPVAQSLAKGISMVSEQADKEIRGVAKKHHIKMTMKKFEPAVNSAVALLRSEFVGEQEGTLVWNYEASIKIYADRLPNPTKGTAAQARLDAQKYLSEVKDKGPTRDNAAAYAAFIAAANTRREIVVGRNMIFSMQSRLKAMKEKGLAATNALDAANNKMVAALNNDNLSVLDIQDFAKKTAAFAQAISQIK
jgi:hypothetical protein